MNWLATIFQVIGTAISGALSSKPSTPEPPAPRPQAPAFHDIDRAEEERLARETAASLPPVTKP